MTNEEIYAINNSYEIACRNLNQQAWHEMSISEKIHDLQAIENKNALDNNRIACEVRAEPLGKGEWGYQDEMQIVVNSNELENPEFLEHVDTMYHEGSHAKDYQAQFVPEVRGQFSQDEIAARNSPSPSPEKDYSGYLNHPGEVAARQADAEGVAKTMADREHIVQVDREINEAHPINQILVTYDYNALDIPVQGESADSVAEGQTEAITSNTNIDGGNVANAEADSQQQTAEENSMDCCEEEEGQSM